MIVVVYQVVGAKIATYHPSLVIGGRLVNRVAGEMNLPWGEYIFMDDYRIW
jgi:hypothetical protein